MGLTVTADGPIMTMKLGGQNLFLLNDPTVVRDLLEKRQGNYSCRPDFYMRSFGDNLNIAMREYDSYRLLGVAIVTP